MAHAEFTAEEAGRLDALLARREPHISRTRWAQAIADGQVEVDGAAETRPGARIRIGSRIRYLVPESRDPHDLTPVEMELPIVFEDDELLVIDKPRGLASHPAASLKSPSLVNALLAYGKPLSAHAGGFRPGIVHRLDKETTGLMVVAKNDAAHQALARQFESKRAERRYVALAAGQIERDRFDIDAPIARDLKDRRRMAVSAGGRPALTHCRVLNRVDRGTLLAVRLSTGRTHQIRVHLRAIGHPVWGDPVYAPPEFRKGPLQLHAALLAFDHPATAARLEFFTRPPSDFLLADAIGPDSLAFDD